MAESFGTDAEGYDRARPGYPDALVARIVAGSPGPGVLDVGCGTGIAARQFQAAGCTVLGIDPDARMAGFARARGLPVEVAAFEAWDPDDRRFDTVIAAQSWHWVDPVAGAAKAAQVLRPGGLLAIFGHVYEPPIEVAGPFAAAYRRVVPDSPFANMRARRPLDIYQAGYARFADKIRETGQFHEAEQWRFDWERSYTRDQWLALLPTTGGLTRLRAGQLTGILDEVGTAIDALGGAFTMRYTTLATTAARVSALPPDLLRRDRSPQAAMSSPAKNDPTSAAVWLCRSAAVHSAASLVSRRPRQPRSVPPASAWRPPGTRPNYIGVAPMLPQRHRCGTDAVSGRAPAPVRPRQPGLAGPARLAGRTGRACCGRATRSRRRAAPASMRCRTVPRMRTLELLQTT